MADRQGFELRRQFYELITIDQAWTSDAPLVERLTSMTWREFVDRATEIEEMEIEVPDVTIMHALIGMAVAHSNPFWSREKTVRFMQRVKLDDVDFVGFEQQEETEEETPAVTAADGNPPEMGISVSERFFTGIEIRLGYPLERIEPRNLWNLSVGYTSRGSLTPESMHRVPLVQYLGILKAIEQR